MTPNEQTKIEAEDGGAVNVKAAPPSRVPTLEEIEAADDRQTDFVDVPEWGPGFRVRIQTLSVDQMDSIASQFDPDKENGPSEFGQAAALAAAGIIEPEGVTAETLGKRAPVAVARIAAAVTRLSGADGKAAEAAEKSFREG